MDRGNGNGNPGPGTPASRAERFEDEKRRIVESCFSKKEPDGSLVETYITHIRITEFSSHLTTPPPPQARTAETEKPRAIIVAVRKSGRVRMHKSKENSNGSFSIGKTWNLDDLSHIESYTGPNVAQNHKEWAGNTGFLVTMGKPYFWQAQTDKEKKFFIASLIKIYSKYTGGKTPDLAGFDQKELEQVLGAGRRPPARPGVSGAVSASPEVSSTLSSAPAPGMAPAASRPMPPQGMPTYQSNNFTGNHHSALPDPSQLPLTPPVRSSIRSPVDGSPAGKSDAPPKDRPMRPWMAQTNRSQDSLTLSIGGRSEDTASLPPRSRNGIAGPEGFGRFSETRRDRDLSPASSRDTLESHPQPSKGGAAPPERKRPPMDPLRPLDRDMVPQPLMSPAGKREPAANQPPPRNVDRVLQRKISEGGSLAGQRSETSSITGSFFDREIVLPTMTSVENMEINAARSDTASITATNHSQPNTRASSPTLRTTMPTFNSDDTRPPPPPLPDVPPETSTEEEQRPGLGPMIRAKKSKGDLAGTLWKAATAASAFKPRPGGAGERLRQAKGKLVEGPDGITGVVPAPPRPASRDAKELEPPPETAVHDEAPPPRIPPRASLPPPVPEVKVTALATSTSAAKDAKKEIPAATEPPRRSVVTGNDAKYLQTLGIDAHVLDSRTEEFGYWLDYFGWVPGEQMRARNVDEMKIDLDREMNTAQAGGWLARFREEDERVEAIKKGLDLAMTECEELDNLLTLYSVELSTLSEDIQYIEAQGQGLQVQTANQKLLKKELESLLETCAITETDLQALQLAPFDNMHGLQDIEAALVTLYKALAKIDPSLGGEPDKPSEAMDADQMYGLNSDFSKMRIVQEKRSMYEREGLVFMQRLEAFMSQQFEIACAETKRALDGALSKKVDATHHNAGRNMLWKYSPLMIYARDAHLENWSQLLQIYQEKSSPLYKTEFQNVVAIWRKNARKLTGEEAELLFSHQQEKKEEGVATQARKMTVKRSQTLAKALRSPLADNSRTTMDKSGANKSMPYEVFAGVLNDLLPLVEMEQNFIVDFFHASTLEHVDFPDAVASSPPRDRQGGDLKRHRLMEPDRDLARRVTRSMEMIFTFLEFDLQKLMAWVIGQDPLQGVGVLVILEKKMADYSQSNQDFINTMLQKLHGNLEIRFRKFVDDQVRAIEETKVKISKRKGVIAFVRVFPTFSTAVENMMEGIDPNLGIRRTIDREYARILRVMFESLMVIARENPAITIAAGGETLEDKETLNFHILLIENMNHIVEDIDTRQLEILEEWKDRAEREYRDHTGFYLEAAMRRPLGKLLDYLGNIEAQIQAGRSPNSIAAQPSNSKTVFNKILGNFDSKEVRKGIEALKKRVEKHFGDADDPALSKGLVIKVLRECEKFYGEVEGRIGRITTDVYGGDVLFEWPRADVKAAFK